MRETDFSDVHIGRPVQQDWTQQLTWKMQTVLLQSLRAPDTHFCPKVKQVARWMRSQVLNNADKKHTFMRMFGGLPTNKELEDELGYCSLHYVSHFVYGLELMAYFHPDEETRNDAFMLYKDLVTDTMHLNMETKEECVERLADVDKKPTIKQPPVEKKKEKVAELGNYWR
jgi:hypothetical protein